MMNEVEIRFRKEFIKPNKRAKALNDFVNHLFNNDHILEANYYLNKLLEIKPRHEKSLSLGYKIAIRMFDIKRVAFFDRQLIEINAKDDLIVILKLEYYCSRNSIQEMHRCLLWFVEQKSINQDYFSQLTEAIIIINDYELMAKLLKHVKKNRLVPSESTEVVFKKIALVKLVKTLNLVRM
jgi:hypothetical protein